MGVGRRMKKQGPPSPLDEFHIRSVKKRKAPDAENDVRDKKRRASGEIPRPVVSRRPLNGVANSGLKYGTKGVLTKRDGSRKPAKSNTTTNMVISEESSDDDAADLLAIDSEEDSTSLGSLDEEEMNNGASGLQDDFLESGSSVYDSDQGRGNMFSEDEGESDAEEKLTAANIEGLSRRLDAEQKDEADEAQLELEEAALRTNIDGDRPRLLQDVKDDEEGATATSRLAPDLQLLRTRITDTIRVLDDFAKQSEEGRSRAEYTSQLLKDICAYYGYSSFLATKLLDLFPPREAFAFFEANESPRPLTIRTNTLKTHRRELAQSLINRGVTLEPVGKWSKVGLQIFESQVPLGATPEYLAGHYMLQAASSFLPVMALAPQPHERVLDMAAAPGGKTTYISALMKNTGCIFANDANKSRAKALIGNIHRLGAKNTIVCSHDAREFPKVIGGFDRVLLDAPCSGTGVIAKDPSVKTNKTEKDFLMLPHLQKQLLLAAIDSVDHASKTGGYIVYSTCSVTVEENEQVVQYALRKRPNVKLVETGLAFGVEGFVNYMGKSFDKSMNMTRRYYPHKYNVDGFFVSKLRKMGPSPADAGHNSLALGGSGIEATVSVDDKALIRDEDGDGEGGFGGWNEEEDEAYIEKAKRRKLKRKGIDPKAKRSASNGHVPDV
ncbi:rRNA (cytosine-C5-)-methyltransferase nop2 [Ptychographa xylographoides]|nr:rRNA (cytosine-C5-)-methyltransferase nop2 [Ptychographa xylographoides]